VYHALTSAPPRHLPDAWRNTAALGRIGRGRSARSGPSDEGAQAETAFKVLDRLTGGLLAEAGLPILGDIRYGGPIVLAGCRFARTMLHAFQLAFAHPVTGERLVVEAPYPSDFRDALDCLRRSRLG
jgi:hypothetical protein